MRLTSTRGLGDGHVCRVGLVPQCVEKSDLESAQQFQRGIRDQAVVGQIGHWAEAKPKDLKVAVNHQDGNKFQAEQMERAGNEMILDGRDPAKGSEALKGILKDAPDAPKRRPVAVDRNGVILVESKCAGVVQSKDMVGMAVGKDDSV